MPEQLQPVIEFVIASFTVDTNLLIQGAIIALLVGFMMSRFGQLIYFMLVALFLDLLIVPLGLSIYEDGMNFGGALETGINILKDLGSEDGMNMGLHRIVFFVVALIVVSILKSIFKRS